MYMNLLTIEINRIFFTLFKHYITYSRVITYFLIDLVIKRSPFKHLVQRFHVSNAGVCTNHITQISGCKNLNNIDNYNKLNNERNRKMSKILTLAVGFHIINNMFVGFVDQILYLIQ